MKKVKIEDLEKVDGLYYVGHLVDIDGSSWVSRAAAEEIIDITNSHVDAIIESIFEIK